MSRLAFVDSASREERVAGLVVCPAGIPGEVEGFPTLGFALVAEHELERLLQEMERTEKGEEWREWGVGRALPLALYAEASWGPLFWASAGAVSEAVQAASAQGQGVVYCGPPHRLEHRVEGAESALFFRAEEIRWQVRLAAAEAAWSTDSVSREALLELYLLHLDRETEEPWLDRIARLARWSPQRAARAFASHERASGPLPPELAAQLLDSPEPEVRLALIRRFARLPEGFERQERRAPFRARSGR